MISKANKEQLRQIVYSGKRGVWAGDLINKTANRELVNMGYVEKVKDWRKGFVYVATRAGRIVYQDLMEME